MFWNYTGNSCTTFVYTKSRWVVYTKFFKNIIRLYFSIYGFCQYPSTHPFVKNVWRNIQGHYLFYPSFFMDTYLKQSVLFPATFWGHFNLFLHFIIDASLKKHTQKTKPNNKNNVSLSLLSENSIYLSRFTSCALKKYIHGLMIFIKMKT